MKQNRQFFKYLLIIVLIAPAIHFFVAGKNQEHDLVRNALVVVQFFVGLAALLFLKDNKAG